jgi:hypothetical protein
MMMTQRTREGRRAHRLLVSSVPAALAAWLAFAADARSAAPPGKAPPTAEDHTATLKVTHDNPRLKFSFRQLSISNLDGTKVPLVGGQLDVYPLSRRWARLGIELEGGAGDASLDGHGVGLWYALAGLSLGFQYPARFTPFVDGRFAFGALGGNLAQAVAVAPNVSLSTASAVTYLLVGGIDVGVEFYVMSRVYLTFAIGWARPIYRGVDYAALTANPSAPVTYADVATDTLTFKLGFGI